MSLKDILNGDRVVAAPGAYDAYSARLIAQAGFPIAYLSGLANEASDLGYPDLGLTTAAELVRRAANIARVVDVPVVCDADTGFGGLANVTRTVREFEAAGISAIHIEDQTFPKRCGALPGKQVIEASAFERTIAQACNARRDDKFLIIARTDAKNAHGVTGVIERLNAYHAAGADAVMTGDFFSADEYREITANLTAPLVACASDSAHEHAQPNFNMDEWQALGVRVVVYWYLALFAASAAVQNAVAELRDLGQAGSGTTPMHDYKEYAEVVDLDAWLTIEDDLSR